MTNHEELRALDKAESKAHRTMMNGSEADACTIRGQEGVNYLAWCKAADACAAYRQAHDLVGKRGYVTLRLATGTGHRFAQTRYR